MARSKIDVITNDTTSDAGAVLWSFVKGEQLEYPVDLDLAPTAGSLPSYTYEAVIVEALNVLDQTEKPTAIKPGGVQTVVTVRVPSYLGTWNAATAYNSDNVVFYSARYWYLLQGTARVNATTPDIDPLWIETAVNRVYVQFPSTLGATWAVQPTVESNTYGFFELRVTEPSGAFPRTWKPVRGMVELLFSPTDIVP